MLISIKKNEITGKLSEKRKNSLLKPKEYWIPKDKLSGGPVFTFSLPEGRFAPLPPVSYATVFGDGELCYELRDSFLLP